MQIARVVQQPPKSLDTYGFIPIRFQVDSKLRLQDLVKSYGREILEDPVEPYWKDYDLIPSEHPAILASRFDTTDWGVFNAFSNDSHVGGAIVACKTPGFEAMGATPASAILVDLRVHPNFRGQGMGSLLFVAAADWAHTNGCHELLVETQDTNVPACKFYSAMGFKLASADPTGYGPDTPEAKLIWRFEFASSPET